MFKSDIGQYPNLPCMQVLRYQNPKYASTTEVLPILWDQPIQLGWLSKDEKTGVREGEIIQPKWVKSHRAASSDWSMSNFCWTIH